MLPVSHSEPKVAKPSIEELAIRYVQIMEESPFSEPSKSDEAWDIINNMAGRIGHENARAAINRAKEIYKLLVPSDPA